ncbi:MAG: phage terminase large subunit [Candidatus Methanomethylicaceae archaeon]
MLDSLDRVERTIKRIERWIPSSGPRIGRMSLNDWLRTVTPHYHWDWYYIQYLCRELENVAEGRTSRLMVLMPPRHGKTALITVRFPVWLMERKQGLRVIVAAYNQTLANKFSRISRRIAQMRLGLNETRKAVEEWETKTGCWYRAVGVGGGITGMGADLIVVDDPVKSREEAQSTTYRERLWDWYTNDLYTRLEPEGSVILVMTRWHEDDLAGRILKSSTGNSWKVVRLPALAEENDPLKRAVGEPLNPLRYSAESLSEIRDVLGSWAFEALYQQHPVPIEGGLFRREWFSKFVRVSPSQVEDRVRYWDKAATAGEGDYTVGVRMSKAEGLYYIEDVTRGRWSPGERDRIIRQCAETDPPGTKIWIEQEPGSSGIDSVQSLIRLLEGFSAHADRVTGSKHVRAEPFAAQAEAGNVVLVQGYWNSSFLDELLVFPNGKHDDQVDAASGAFSKLARSQILKARSWQG